MNGNALVFFASKFYGKKEKIQLIVPAERKKIAEEENGLQPERVHAHHLGLRLTP